MVSRPVASLPLGPGLKQRLFIAGFTAVADLQGLTPTELAADASIAPEEALLVLEVAGLRKTRGNGLAGATSAYDLYQMEVSTPKITTSCRALDGILGGGVALGQITEFCGVPAIGKTQLGIQLAINAQLPKVLGGLEGGAVYIDTEGSVVPERVHEIAEAAVHNVRTQAANLGADNDIMVASTSAEQLTGNIHYFRVRDHIEQVSVLEGLFEFIRHHPEVKIVLVDSITFHFRQNFPDLAHRARVLAGMAQKLMQMANSMRVAVVLVNQVTTKIDGDMSRLVPALGDSWAHSATSRIVLFWRGTQRCAFTHKSPWLPGRAAQYSITAAGIRDFEQHEL